MTEDQAKVRYAALLLKHPNDYFAAALELYPGDTSKALLIMRDWPTDPIVIDAKFAKLEDVGELAMLPDKAMLARKVWDLLDRTEMEPEEFVKVAKLYAEIRGYIEKPGLTVNNNTQVNNRVMVIKDLGTDAEWESTAAAQQRNLLNVSTSRH